METNRRPAYRRQMYHYYDYGNTVRKPNEVFPKHEEVHQVEPKKVSRQIRQNRKNALRMSKGYVVFLTIAVAIAFVVCLQYLQLCSEVANRSRNITSLQRELTEKKEVNTIRFNNAIDFVNLEEVRKKATEKLGMVHAKDGQIIIYDNPIDNDIKQYKEIPKK
ncbi:hypothetical protein [Faecalimonas sp.]